MELDNPATERMNKVLILNSRAMYLNSCLNQIKFGEIRDILERLNIDSNDVDMLITDFNLLKIKFDELLENKYKKLLK